MTTYRKTMAEALKEVYLGESVIDKVKEIASKKSAKKIDGVMVDSFTASAISQIYDKVNDANKKKMEKLPITKLANLAFKMMQKSEFVPEEVELGEMFGISSNSNHRAKTMKMLDGMGIKYKKDGRNGLIILGVAPKDQKGILDKIHKDIGMTTYRIMD